ncbi:hypothetical protein AMECASPLE_027245 [Ameca splendens]|uniref:Uncharacterized protein n=1 Tax=Ameca splendens TaxID=208324 RepID=A0ABV0XI99_9TELE
MLIALCEKKCLMSKQSSSHSRNVRSKLRHTQNTMHDYCRLRDAFLFQPCCFSLALLQISHIFQQEMAGRNPGVVKKPLLTSQRPDSQHQLTLPTHPNKHSPRGCETVQWQREESLSS